MTDQTTTPEQLKYDTHEKRRTLAAHRYKGDRNAINDRVHVTLTKMNLRNGYADALEKHAAPLEARIAELEGQLSRMREAGEAVVNRWDSPQWEWDKHGHTASLIADLRKSLDTPTPTPTPPNK